MVYDICNLLSNTPFIGHAYCQFAEVLPCKACLEGVIMKSIH